MYSALSNPRKKRQIARIFAIFALFSIVGEWYSNKMKFVYLLKCGDSNYKVGSATDVSRRIVSIQSSNPDVVELVCARLVIDSEIVESMLQSTLTKYKTRDTGEWFSLDPSTALQLAIKISKLPQPKILKSALSVELLVAQMRSEYQDVLTELRLINKQLRLKNQPHAVKGVSESSLRPTDFESPIQVVRPTPNVRHERTDEEIEKEALKVFQVVGRASTSLLQGRLSIGYARAARIMDSLEKQGKISKYDGANSRVLITD